MIDHVLGRPSSKFRKVQVFSAVSFWSLYLLRGNRHGPPLLRRLSKWFSKRGLTPWQLLVLTLLYLYVARNFAKTAGLESPEPLANLYSRAYFRATWITTALDAGFWTAMRIKSKKIRDLASIVFTVYYLIAAEQADEKVRKVRAVLTVDHLRVSWNKSTTPYLNFFTSLLRPKFMKHGPRRLRIPRPRGSTYKEPVDAWMYFDGTLAELEKQTNLVLDIPGGGFVAMSPRESDDKLLAWAGKTGLPILSLDYRKAPEFPYPYALNECFDVYAQIVATKGRCIGLKSEYCPRVVLTGDSAGGNLATGTALMIIESNLSGTRGMMLPSPAGLVLLYPALDMNIGSWMTDDQMALIRNPRTKNKKEYENFIKRKSEDIDRKYTPTTPRPSDSDEAEPASADYDFFSCRPQQQQRSGNVSESTEHEGKERERQQQQLADADVDADVDVGDQQQTVAESKPQPLRTRLAVSSIISYFGDRILTPEMMRAMIILYVGPYNRPDFKTDHLLCPAVAPESLLAKFPKTYFLTGERDPLVDDTVVFAGRLRQAKLHLFRERQELGLEKSQATFNEKDHVEVTLIPGISHGFVQFVSIFPEGWRHIFRCANWVLDIFATPPHAFEGPAIESRLRSGSMMIHDGHRSGSGLDMPRHHRRTPTGESEFDDDAPLAMSVGTPPPLAAPTPTSTSKSGSSKVINMKGKASGSVRNSHHREGRGGGSGSGSANANTNVSGRGRGRDSESRSKFETRSKSMISLGSEEDLLKRRMQSLTVNMMGTDGGG